LPSPYPLCLRQYPHHHTTTDRFTHERLEKKMVHPLVSIRSLKVEEEAYKAFVSSGGVCEQRWWFGIDDCIRKDVLLMKINGVDPVTFEPIQRESDASVPTPQSSQELDQNSPVH
ncbi:unnamed protein product, partial [Brassica oleracea var. botrytis]